MKNVFIAGWVGVLLFAPSNAGAASSAFDVADQLSLVPTPREIALTSKKYALDGWAIVVPEKNDLARAGAEEINDRIKNLGGAELPIRGDVPSGPALVIGPCRDALVSKFAQGLGVTPSNPGEQGYAIKIVEEGGRPLLLAVGSDDLGTLYACMTIRQLIQSGKDGHPALLGAAVRDWPAFKRRCLGRIGCGFKGKVNPAEGVSEKDQIIADARNYIRWLAQHKINMADLTLPPKVDDDDHRRIMDFGRRYGLKYRYVYTTNINRELEETGNPWTGCVTRESAKHCWTAFDEHRLKARRIAEEVHNLGYNYVVHHVTDSGALPDPETWSRRCQRCRDYYGDDQPRAVADQLKLYHDAIKALNPDVLFDAVLQPYHFQWAVDGFVDHPMAAAKDMPHEGHVRGLDDPEVCRRAVERAKAIHRAVSSALPPEAMVTFREAGRAEFDGCCALWPGHPVDIWVYYGRNMGWDGLWEPQVRLIKTWYREGGPRDLLFSASVGRPTTVYEVSAAASAEYAWNVGQPDADTAFEIAKRRYEVGGRDTSEYQKQSLLPRICRGLWGRNAEAVAPLFANNVSFNYMGDPEYVSSARGEDFDDPYKYWDEQTRMLNDARKAINQAVADVDAGKPSGVYGDLRREYGYTSFMMLYYYTNLAALKGTIESAALAAARAMAQGRPDEATRLAEEMAARIPEIAAEAQRVKQRIEGDRRVTVIPDWKATPASAKRPARNPLLGYDFAAQTPRFAALVSDLRSDVRFGAIPEHLKEILGKRRVEAVRAEFRNPFIADGRRGEGGWVSSLPAEFFTVAGDGSALAKYDTRVWTAWTGDALVIFAEMRDAPGAKPVAPKRPHDDKLFADDCFEVFVAPSAAGEDYFHFAVNAAGATFEGRGKENPIQWNGQWEAGVHRVGDLWTAELRIPFSTLGATPKPGDTWRVNLARTRAGKPSSPKAEVSNIIASPTHHALDKFTPMTFVERPTAGAPEPEVRLLSARREDMTVTYGFATQLWVKPEIVWWRQSRDVAIRVAAYDGDKELAAKTFDERSLPGHWSPDREIAADLGAVVEGDVRIDVSAKADDGTLDTARSFRLTRQGKVVSTQ